jgi:hypothetical protein
MNKEWIQTNKERFQLKDLGFNIVMLQLIIASLLNNNKHRSTKFIRNANNLFTKIIDVPTEDNMGDRIAILLIRNICEALMDGVVITELVIERCKNHHTYNDAMDILMKYCINKSNDLSQSECGSISKIIDDRMMYITVASKKEALISALDNIDIINNPKGHAELSKKLVKVSNEILNLKRNLNSLESNTKFSIADEDSWNNITDQVITSLTSRNRIFRTGIKRLNSMLSPGLEGTRLYMFIAPPKSYKSVLLEKIALDIKMYNEPIICKDPTKIPTILYITMENTEQETYDRLFSMITGDSIANYSRVEALKQLKRHGFTFDSAEHNVNIIIEYCKYRSISTDDLYDRIKQAKDEGYEIVALVLDYIKRIRPSIPDNNSEKVENARVMNELKAICVEENIPGISAAQINRNGANKLEEAAQKGQADNLKLLSGGDVGTAYEVIETADCSILLSPCYKPGTTEKYVEFKLAARRSTDSTDPYADMKYFVHPLNQNMKIQLVDDVNDKDSCSLESLASPLLASENQKKKKKQSTSKDYLEYIDDMDIDYSKNDTIDLNDIVIKKKS